MTDQKSGQTGAAPADVWTVRRVLEWTTGHLQKHGSETPRLDAEVLLAHSRGCPRIKLYTEYDEPLSDTVRAKMKELVKRRAAREPVAYLVGSREFFSLTFQVTPDVLIPRPDTEALVVEALAVVKAPQPVDVLELCTGSGCIAISIAVNAPLSRVTATDISPAALSIAAQNAARHQVEGRISFSEGDLWHAVPPNSKFDVIVSNPPYVTRQELAALDDDVRKYEPHLALDGGIDGLDQLRTIVAGAPDWLHPGGWLLLEMDPAQIPKVDAMASETRCYTEASCVKDLAGRPRVWKGCRV